MADVEFLVLGPTRLRLGGREEEIDAERFDALVGEGIAAVEREPRRAIDTLRVALAMWRGTPFPDVDVPALADWARRLTERRLTAIESLSHAGDRAPDVRELRLGVRLAGRGTRQPARHDPARRAGPRGRDVGHRVALPAHARVARGEVDR
ncbi:BTAD domain-containing putative transcriptional regulator [Actinophytocola gossypii]|uniref:Bacterial transcriptional activator domain-containing protein n=1 Tax=Actinophytocola gossypii TaxID=2812003 RepID=A0ABT2JFV4_9PSEU|nr:BTAD domain-containing putative transcriptional regulator [Actinophytocola gossypii]MCT2586755.1 hypothetical protein [Actinophytocola gossypii]